MTTTSSTKQKRATPAAASKKAGATKAPASAPLTAMAASVNAKPATSAKRAPLPSRSPMRIVLTSADEFIRVTTQMRLGQTASDLARRVLVGGERLMDVARSYTESGGLAAKQVISRAVLNFTRIFLHNEERGDALVEVTLVLPVQTAMDLVALQDLLVKQGPAGAREMMEPVQRAASRVLKTAQNGH